MTDLIAADPARDEEPEKFDFNSPEDVIFEVVAEEYADQTDPHWGVGKHSIESATVLNGAEGVTGAASYEQAYGSFLDYAVGGLIDCPGEGWWVMEGVTAVYHRGDGFSSDDDMDFDYVRVRRATVEEIARA